MKLDLLNLLALLCALGLATAGAGLGGTHHEPPPRAAPTRREPSRAERLADGSLALRDARSVLVPLRDYRRIASGSLVSDRVLLDLCEPARVVAFSRAAQHTPLAFRYADKPALGARDDVEHVLALKPDLLILSDLVDPSYIARLEERGIRVFVLRPMTGLSSLLLDIGALGALIGESERAARYGRTLQERLSRVAAGVAGPGRPRALYLSSYGGKLFAAGAATSYHDVIHYAGLADAAAMAGLMGWPELTSERVLAIDPDVLITRRGMAAILCRHPGLSLLRACRPDGRLIELDGALLDDPGPAMLEAAEALRDATFAR